MLDLATTGRDLLNQKLRPRGEHTQTWLARALGIGQPAISHWCNGRSRPEPHHRTALQLLLGIPEPAWLTQEEIDAIERVREFMGHDAPVTSDEETPAPSRSSRPPAARSDRPRKAA